MTRQSLVLLGCIAILFVALRVPGTSLPLHQDEYKWPQITNPATNTGIDVPHPPLGEFIYREAGYMIGFDTHFRFVPLAFSVANLLLLFYWLRRRVGERAAFIGAILFASSFFSVLASLMVDTDGAILPFFLLLALIAYDLARRDPRGWALVTAACVSGFLVKASFVLVVGALIADVLWDHRQLLYSRKTLWLGAGIAGLSAALALVLVAASYIFPFFDVASSLRYWMHFASFHHNWFQIAIQAVKAAFYLSPLLVLMPFWATRDDLERVRPLLFFTVFGLVFYLVLFDFSVGALDRYLQFLIVPLVSLAAVMLDRSYRGVSWRALVIPLIIGSVAALGIFAVQFAAQAVPSLYPKAAWLARILSFHWTFLYPFSGGSGPLTFYISFAFLAGTWVVSGALIFSGLFARSWRHVLLLILIPLSFGYNAAFIEEYLAGRINGSTPTLVERAAAYVAADPDIARIVVYNDNGGYEIQLTGKYEKRLYTSPDFDWNQKAATMNAFKGHYLVIDAPPVDPESFFAKYFATCIPVYQDADKYMHATVYDCRSAPAIVL